MKRQYLNFFFSFFFADGSRFPVLAGQSSAPSVGSLEDDSHCMSFAQVSFRKGKRNRCCFSTCLRDLYPAQMLRDGKARADAGLRMTPKKGKWVHLQWCSPFNRRPRFCDARSIVRVLQINCSPRRQRTAMERATGPTGFLCRASRTLSVRPLKRPCCSWTARPLEYRCPSSSQVRPLRSLVVSKLVSRELKGFLCLFPFDT